MKKVVQGMRIKRGNNLDTYHGEVENGVPNGRGLVREDNGTIYEGEWKDGEKVGKGTMYFSNGDMLIANWDIYPFYGIWRLADGWVYEGDFNGNWNMHGCGKMTSPSGEITKGMWEDGQFKRSGFVPPERKL